MGRFPRCHHRNRAAAFVLLLIIFAFRTFWQRNSFSAYPIAIREDQETRSTATSIESLHQMKLPFTTHTTQKIPKFIWTYWGGGITSEFVDACVRGWILYNPDHKVTVIQAQTITDHINVPLPPLFYSNTFQAQSDWVRIAVLAAHGGIWLDASFIVTGSINYIHERQESEQTEGFIFYLNGWTTIKEYPLYESWLISSVPNGQFITALLVEFTRAIDSGSLYLWNLKWAHGMEKYGRLIQGNAMPSYCKIHVAMQKIIQIDGITLLTSEAAETAPAGPYQYLAAMGWDADRFCKLLLDPWVGDVPIFFKLRSHERAACEKKLISELPDKSSILGRFLDLSTNKRL